MSYVANVTVDRDDIRRSGLQTVIQQLNNVIQDVRTLQTAYNAALAKLDADAGITDTDYASSKHVLDASLLAAKVTR